jgi:hypothetical protein
MHRFAIKLQSKVEKTAGFTDLSPAFEYSISVITLN